LEAVIFKKEERKMTRITVRSRIDANGVLRVAVPVSPAYANQEVQVTIEPIGPPPITQEEWRAFVLSTAGKWEGDLERPDQGEYEERESLP
jgi:hypothetical protein